MASTALPQTLRSITNTKIKELSKQRTIFEKRRAEIVQSANATSDLRAKARILLEGVTKLKGHANDAFDKEDLDVDAESFETPVKDGTERAVHANIRRFLLQGKYDPSVSESSLREWIESLEGEIVYMERAHDHASFYSALVTEWLEELEASGAASVLAGEEEQGVEDSGMETVGRAEMHEQRKTWEDIVFSDSNVQADAIRTYLDNLFTQTALSQQALKELRETIKSFATSLAAEKTWITVDDLSWISGSLLRTDLLSKEKTVILKELMRNNAVAQEVADVLNMRIASLESWSWPDEGIQVEMRRQLNGKYRVFMDEDLLDSLMFQYLGSKWAVALRSAFVTFLGSRGWKKPRDHIPEHDRLRRSYFVGQARARGLNEERQRVYAEDYFMSQLPSSVETEVASYDDNGEEADRPKNALETKHSLLHLLLAESILHTTLHGQFTAVRSDFKWFGPSLPHTTMLTVLSYFGVPQEWLNFFRTFLEAPMKFVNDGPSATAAVRKTGIPMSHTLSSAMGEAVLFCMDYAVNQSTDGAYLYRLHDDFWFWGQESTCVKAWTAMTEFANIMGLEFNEEKTGTVRWQGACDKVSPILTTTSVGSAEEDLLPTGDIRWGFLKLDSQERRFIIDQDMVTEHTVELQRQLSACKSVFAWIQAWNSYFGRFFVNNFAKPAVCFGREHIDMAVSTLSHIEHALFPDSNGGGVTNSLRKTIAERFNVHDIPDGLFYFPIEFGGLNLLNPYIPLLAMREDIKQTPHRRIQKAFLDEEAAYLSAKEEFEQNGPKNPGAFLRSKRDFDLPTDFLSLEEYMKYAESFSRPLLDAYLDLIRIPDEFDVNLTPAMRGTLTLSAAGNKTKTISGNWPSMSPYWKWTAELYRAGMVKRYGNLAAVNREFMPVGVVETLKEGKFRWQG
ncbi:uncharacterized protein DSM5745_01638 [Aspergillus mulundensis]|uniref:Reverse transcriptase domain-containing protein n=1 Tax=Aspergillus mulundensis TaxID=1810919 RepID=A0A3D8SU73_9EURO|nr:Uncharacterized protein DSM5745_01638 [Aspergillus mulundensis]RDW89863.1 Uncharacterized protein DSM5745_01638 [Aspergillus mulundensis]